MHLQAAWFQAISHNRVLPSLAQGRSVYTDGWYHKFLARVALAPALDYERVAGFFQDVVEPDCVILLDAEPETTVARKTSFTEIEGGNFDGRSKATQETFARHQAALREKLLEMADAAGWVKISVAGKSEAEVWAAVVEALEHWRLDHNR